MEDVLHERERQISEEGWTPAHDDQHKNGEMAKAAACYLACDGNSTDRYAVMLWPMEWDLKWWKPKDRRRNLVRAGALVLAEIERLDRLNGNKETENEEKE